jgi:trans-aconitate 2-methyltransferase
VLDGVSRALRPGGRLIFQMGGRGNAADLVEVLDELVGQARWRSYFTDFEFPYGFYGTEEYGDWLEAAGLEARRIELVAKDLSHPGQEGFEGWFRTTWLPFTERVPQDQRAVFIDAVVGGYLMAHPPDAGGATHLGMVRLEVEALRPA